MRATLVIPLSTVVNGSRDRIGKRLRGPGIDSIESIPPAYVAWRDGTLHWADVTAPQAGNRFLDYLKGLQIRAQSYISSNLFLAMNKVDANQFYLIQLMVTYPFRP